MIELGITICFASKELITPLVKALKKARLDQHEQLRTIGDEFFDPLKLSRLYIEPSGQHYNPAETDEDSHAISAIRAPVFKQLSDFFSGEYTSTQDGNNQLLILADAGMGKTSLLVMLKLFHWNGCWPAGIRCELIKLGDDSLERINKLTDRTKTILLLDSLDEDPLAWNRLDQRLLDLLDATKNFRRVVISCRTQFFPDGDKDPFARTGKLEIGGFVCPMYYLSPFSPQQVNEYLEKKFPSTWFAKLFSKQNQNKIRALEIIKKMRSLRMRPFLLSNIEYLLEESATNWNDYSVYVALVKQWLNREEIKIREQARIRGKSTKSLPDRQKLWSVCEIIALWAYEKRVRSITETEYQKVVRSHPDVEMIEELEHGSKSLLNKHSKGFRFSHYSIQEFLIVNSRNPLLPANYFTPQMWTFASHIIDHIPHTWLKMMPENTIYELIEQHISTILKNHRLQSTDNRPVYMVADVFHSLTVIVVSAKGSYKIRDAQLIRALKIISRGEHFICEIAIKPPYIQKGSFIVDKEVEYLLDKDNTLSLQLDLHDDRTNLRNAPGVYDQYRNIFDTLKTVHELGRDALSHNTERRSKGRSTFFNEQPGQW